MSLFEETFDSNVTNFPICRLPYGKEGAVRNRFAEEAAGEVARLREELAKWQHFIRPSFYA